MQTFLPYADFARSASCLDRQRLGKQRVETYQILRALRGESKGWINHPATRMWKNHEAALAEYGVAICSEWISRGYRDSLLPYFKQAILDLPSCTYPLWIGREDFHRSHQSNLVRKMPAHYAHMFPDVPADLPYIWPDVEGITE